MKSSQRMFRSFSLPALGVLMLGMGIVGGAGAAPITFNTALPVADGELLFRQQIRWLRSDEDPSDMDRDMSALASVSVLGYGVNSRLALFGVLPWLDKSLDVTVAGGDTLWLSPGLQYVTRRWVEGSLGGFQVLPGAAICASISKVTIK